MAKEEKEKKEKVKGFFTDFKAFIAKGNVLDMAVGVVIGSAFSAIVSSLVSDVISPVIGKLTAGIDFKELKWVITEAEYDAEGTAIQEEIAVNYGNFIHNIVYFLLVAFAIFLVVRIVRKSSEHIKDRAAKSAELLKDKLGLDEDEEAPAEEPAAAPEPAPAPAPEPAPADESADLLREIRDLLKAQNEGSKE